MSPRRSWVLVFAVIGVAVAAAALGAQRGAAPPAPASPTIKAAPLPQAGTAAISGVVVDGSTGRPIQGAFVNLTAAAKLPGPTRAVTDSQGRFVFSRLPAASYTISVLCSGYFRSQYGQIDPNTFASRAIPLGDGQWFADARIVLWKPGAISGTIRDEAGEPVVSAPVRVLKHVMVAGQPQIAGGTVAKTDDRGRYRVAGLSKGRYAVIVPSVQASVPADTTLLGFSGYRPDRIKLIEDTGRPVLMPDDPAIFVDPFARLVAGRYAASLPPGSGMAYPPTMFPAGRTLADAAVIDLDIGEERSGIDIQIAPVRTVRISGLVEGPPEAVAGMTLRLLPAGSETLGYGSEMATALVPASGAFTLINVPSGTYTLIASRSTMEYTADDLTSLRYLPEPPGWAGGNVSIGVIDSGSGGARYSVRSVAGPAHSARMTVTVGDQNLSGVIVPLRRAATMTGRIDGAVSPGPGVRGSVPMIYAVPANGDPSLGMSMNEPVSLSTFRIGGLLAGGYVLRFSGPGTVKSIEWQGRDYRDRAFDASDGRDIENVVITLTPEVSRIAGSVRDARGQLAGGGAVIAFPTDRSLWTNYGFSPLQLKSKPISTNGEFSISPLPAGDYYVIAVEDAQATLWQDPKFLEAAAVPAAKVTVGWGETKTLSLIVNTVKMAR